MKTHAFSWTSSTQQRACNATSRFPCVPVDVAVDIPRPVKQDPNIRQLLVFAAMSIMIARGLEVAVTSSCPYPADE